VEVNGRSGGMRTIGEGMDQFGVERRVGLRGRKRGKRDQWARSCCSVASHYEKDSKLEVGIELSRGGESKEGREGERKDEPFG
jgi:hypothetical protein